MTGSVLKYISVGLSFLFLPYVSFTSALAGKSPDISSCAAIEDKESRLDCYDAFFPPKSIPSEKNVDATQQFQQEKPIEPSYLSKLWGLDPQTRHPHFSFVPHRSSYILPFSQNNLPNKKPLKGETAEMDVDETEVAYQISFKVELWPDILGKDLDLWFGYTQRSFWQLFNTSESSPFRETNYEPEMLFNYRTHFDRDFLGLKCRMITLGFNHQSNGRSEPYSRSWNRIVANLGFERDDLTLLVKTWYRIPESSDDDDNPDTDDYFGYGEVWGHYYFDEKDYGVLGGHRFGIMVRNNLQTSNNRGALQLEWNFPLLDTLSGYIQYFTGYGENLLDYDHSVNRIGIGVMINDWN